MSFTSFRDYRFSLRARTTTWYVGLLAVALTVFSIGIYVGLRTYMKETLQRGLSGTVHTISDDIVSKWPSKGQAWVLGEVRESYDASPNDHFVRLTIGQQILYRTADMSAPSIPIDRIALPVYSEVGAFHRQKVNGQVVMIYSLPYQGKDGRVVEIEAGTALFTMQQTLRSLTKILLMATLLILIFATMGGYWLMKRPLMPLVLLTEKAANIGRKELGERLPVIPTGDELERLTHSLNGMIGRLEEALAHNHRFSADASHELRTPLTIMRGEMEEMLRMEGLPPQAMENLVSTLEEIDRMSRIVNSLLVITRLDGGGERMDTKVLNLSMLVRTTMDHMRLLAEEKGLPLTCSCEREVYVEADPMRIKQVLVNLIDNAIKYTPSAGSAYDMDAAWVPAERRSASAPAPGSVDVTVFASGGQACLKVADHGMGIGTEVLPYVFDRFYRADYARSRGAGGAGLGLAIVKAIVAAHHGTVSISSLMSQGTTVLVQLPLTMFVPAEIPSQPAIAAETIFVS